MGLVAPIILISVGSIILLVSAILGFGGYPYIIKSSFKSILRAAMVKSEVSEFWIENPVPIHANAKTFNMTPIPLTLKGPNNAGKINEIFTDPPGLILGLGEAIFRVEMESWAPDDGGIDDVEEEGEKETTSSNANGEDIDIEERKEEQNEPEDEPTPKLVPFVWASEEFALDKVQRVAIVLGNWNINLWIIIGYILITISLIITPIGILQFKKRKINIVSEIKEKKNKVW